MIKIAVILEKCEEGGFAASVPTVPGCFSEGETVEEALANIAEAIELHLEAVDDDLIVDDDVIVKELLWQPVGRSTEAATPKETGQAQNSGPNPPSSTLGDYERRHGARPPALMLEVPPSDEPEDEGS